MMGTDTLQELTLAHFTAALASRAPVPGGGGASALAGALAASLAGMVCTLTAGKKRYAAYEEEIGRISERAEVLRLELLRQIDADAEAFEPLSRVYSIPKDAPERGEVMEAALRAASEPPMRMMELSSETLRLLAELMGRSSVLAVSDIGVGALLAGAALRGAGLNVAINVKSMSDRAFAEKLASRAGEMLSEFVPLSEELYRRVAQKIDS